MCKKCGTDEGVCVVYKVCEGCSQKMTDEKAMNNVKTIWMLGIQTKYGQSWIDDIVRYDSETEAKSNLANRTVKRVVT